jgi:uncharacterized protein YdcH (DUF465 family)
MLADFLQAITDAAPPILVNPQPLTNPKSATDPELQEEILAPAAPDAQVHLQGQAAHFAQLLTQKFHNLNRLGQQLPDAAEVGRVDSRHVSNRMQEHLQLKAELLVEQQNGEAVVSRVLDALAVLSERRTS